MANVKLDERIAALSSEAAQAGDLAQVGICAAALSGDASARAECERVISNALAQHEGRNAPPSLLGALDWARRAEASEYLVRYADDGLSADSDFGSRCGYADDELAAIERVLRARNLTLEADDVGLAAAERS